MMGDFMGKMQEAQQQMEETKKRLDGVFVDVEIENGAIKASASANLKVTNISISDGLLAKNNKYIITKKIGQEIDINPFCHIFFRLFILNIIIYSIFNLIIFCRTTADITFSLYQPAFPR